jgi:hypothetical protein
MLLGLENWGSCKLLEWKQHRESRLKASSLIDHIIQENHDHEDCKMLFEQFREVDENMNWLYCTIQLKAKRSAPLLFIKFCKHWKWGRENYSRIIALGRPLKEFELEINEEEIVKFPALCFLCYRYPFNCFVSQGNS